MNLNLKKIFTGGALLIFSGALYGCGQNNQSVATTPFMNTQVSEKPQTQTQMPLPQVEFMTVSVDTPFVLKIGQAGVLKPSGASVVFDSVKSDSRCPKGVQCVWAGEVTVHVKTDGLVVGGKSESSIDVSSVGGPVLLGEIDGVKYSLQLVDLAPYPDAGTKKASSDYSATLKLIAGGISG